ncbi:MAG: flavocytochrome c, partial [Solobacterium sp.]|nr:flavocytochrome c [Solobacterium sp.]
MKKLSISLVTLVLAGSLIGCNKATETTTSAKMKAGTYTASAAGMNDDVTVEVEVTENEIKSIKV